MCDSEQRGRADSDRKCIEGVECGIQTATGYVAVTRNTHNGRTKGWEGYSDRSGAEI